MLGELIQSINSSSMNQNEDHAMLVDNSRAEFVLTSIDKHGLKAYPNLACKAGQVKDKHDLEVMLDQHSYMH